MGDDGGAERRLAGAHRLQSDALIGEHRRRLDAARNRLRCSRCRAQSRRRRSVPSVERDAARLDRLDVAHPHDVGDSSQLLEFGLRQDRAPVHRRVDGGVDAHADMPLASSRSNRSGSDSASSTDAQLIGEVAQHPLGELSAGLDRGAVQDPRVAGFDPRQPLRRDRRAATATGMRPSRSCPHRRSRICRGPRGCAAGRWAVRTRHRSPTA